jgi:hypothetical protein
MVVCRPVLLWSLQDNMINIRSYCKKCCKEDMFELSTACKWRSWCMHIIFSSAKDFRVVQKRVAEIVNRRILVGHALHNDLKVRYLDWLFFLLFIGWIFSSVPMSFSSNSTSSLCSKVEGEVVGSSLIGCVTFQ